MSQPGKKSRMKHFMQFSICYYYFRFITCFPNGDDDASQGSLSLMLRVYTEAPIKFVTNLKIGIFSKLSGTLKSKTIQQSQAFGWLFSSFMSHDELFRNSKLHNDKLGIILKVHR